MTEAERLRRAASFLRQAEEELDAVIRMGDDDTQDTITAIAQSVYVAREAVSGHADMLDPPPFVPTLWEYRDGLERRVIR